MKISSLYAPINQIFTYLKTPSHHTYSLSWLPMLTCNS